MARTLSWTMLVLAGALSAARAQGVEEKTTQQLVDQYAAAAASAMKTNDFDEAIRLYAKANALDPSPELVYDLAQASRKQAEFLRKTNPSKASEARDQARAYYQRFLDSRPTNEAAELNARGQLGRLEDWWKAESPKEEAARRAAEDARREEATRIEQARLAEDRRRQRERDEIEQRRIGSAVLKTRIEGDRTKGRIYQIAGGSAIGLGAAGIAIGAYYGLKARALSNDLTAARTYDKDRLAEGHQDERYMSIAYVAGGALLVGGAIAYWRGRDIRQHADQPQAALTVAATPDGGAVVVWGSF